MWIVILILFVVLLTTQIILNLIKILDYVEMLKTAKKKTAKIMNDTLEETLNGVRKEEDDGI